MPNQTQDQTPRAALRSGSFDKNALGAQEISNGKLAVLAGVMLLAVAGAATLYFLQG